MSYNYNCNGIEIGIALEKFHYKSKGKFYIPSLLPLLSSSSPYNTTLSINSTSALVNKTSLPVNSIKLSNYVELYVPEYVSNELPKVPLTNEEIIAKGAQVQIVFTGGDITKPKIIGAYV